MYFYLGLVSFIVLFSLLWYKSTIKITLMKPSKVLEYIKKNFQNKKETSSYICINLEDCYRKGLIKRTVYDEIRSFISQQLEGCASYEGWLIEKRSFPYKTIKNTDLREERIKWLGSMIDYYKARGR